MPQIAQLAETYSSQIFWLLVIFGFVFFVIGKGMVPRVMGTVELRDKQINDDLAGAEAARNQANAEEEAWRQRENENRAQAQALVAKAKADAAIASEGKLAAAQGRIDEKLSAAEAKIAEARTSALAELESVASEAAQTIVEKLAGVSVPATSASSAVKKVLSNG
ncbi:ATP synthase subunit b [Caenibius tardaugens NBRC 16725]|uniref:ATP synthase subunit b n=1 Tax=Caenibius tardaugens NBRC 16725 TaxID=1219035 RepID=U3A0M6_9SPHN|nr:ATP synthase subunit B [Caenibius tardaugens]AZI34782.1 ATPase [Caenibius tardaugens NBRC 16725]GAD48303.1 ATP synthase subunit b [Caenibius tardaugens NBRC 16725]